MKLNDTKLNINPRNHCCLLAFAQHFPDVEHEDAGEVEFPNPDVSVGESFECPFCKNVILLTEAGRWESVDPSLVMDLSDPAPTVEIEDRPIIPATLTPAQFVV
jgi:hypothetical protein